MHSLDYRLPIEHDLPIRTQTLSLWFNRSNNMFIKEKETP